MQFDVQMLAQYYKTKINAEINFIIFIVLYSYLTIPANFTIDYVF